MQIRVLLILCLSLGFCVAKAAAQEWRVEQIVDAGIEMDAPGRLERLPMQLGEEAIYHRARLRPKDDKDYVRAQYAWNCDIFEFSKKEIKADDLPSGISPELGAQLKKVIESGLFKRYKSFKDWIDDKDKKDLTIVSEGKPRKGRAGKLDYFHWIWREDSGFGPAGTVYCEAAVYSFADKEVALVIEMPLETKNPPVPKTKWKTLIDRMIASGKKINPEAVADDVDKKKDQYANTPEKALALTNAKKNIQSLQGWDYFTSPNYIVLYAWDFEKPDERIKSKKDAEFFSSRLEKMRELYATFYPLDESGAHAVMPDPSSIPSYTAPVTGVQKAKAGDPGEEDGSEEITGKGPGQSPYPVFRLCATYDQFSKYGGSPPGVVGWFSPASKELVVFLGGDKLMGPGATETVTYHEGWHQFADLYFHPQETKKHATLHRWFDEGHGDYFGSFRLGQSGWKYTGSKMRYEDCKQMVRLGDFVPFHEIVYWDQRRFYSGQAAYYYAQAFSMIDFLRRGEKSRGWKPRYGEILELYRKVVLTSGDAKMAVDTAFHDFKPEDWRAMEEAWKVWVASPDFLTGK